MTSREQQVLGLIRQDPMAPQVEIAKALGISRSAVAGHIMKLTSKGLIRGRGYVLSDAPFVTVIGGANIDIHGKSAKALRAQDSNPGVVHISAGGVARNIADNLARLGVDSRLISAIGTDHHGQMLMRLSRAAGIDTQFVHEETSAQTSTYMSVLDDTGEMQVAINDMSIIESLTAERLEAHRRMLAQSALIVVDCNLPAKTLAWLCSTFRNTPIFADTVSVAKALRIKSCIYALHTLKASADELATLTGRNSETQAQLKSLADSLHAEGLARLFVTRGEKGVFYSTAAEQGFERPVTVARDVVSTGGAGDAFLAGVAYSWLEDWPLDKTLRIALAAADITLSHPATNSPSLSVDTLNAALERHGGG